MKEITVTIRDGENRRELTLESGTPLLRLVNQDPTFGQMIVAAKVDERLVELGYRLFRSAEVEFVTTATPIGYDMYKRSLILLMVRAYFEVFPEKRIRVLYSLGQGFFCTVHDTEERILEPTPQELAEVKKVMRRLVEEKLPIEKKVVKTSDAVRLFRERGMEQKAELFRYRRASRVNLYSLDGYEDYFYGYMLPSTEGLSRFNLIQFDDGFVLVVPRRNSLEIGRGHGAPESLYTALREAEDWGNQLGLSGVGQLNTEICNGHLNDLILIQEAVMEKQIADIAEEIHSQKKKLVLIAGPSSSGKTTFSNRLSVQLRAHGLTPHPIAMDNFFKERVDTPKDENGQYDFECIGAMDLELFNNTMERLLEGEEVPMPRFDFTLGEKKFDGRTLKLTPEDVLVVEGIHALNPASTYALPSDSSYKIYISALTQLNLDEHNRISTSDTRLLRRIVRDNRTRGNNAANTIRMWESVRRGEERNIFPYQGEADALFNSALIYELPAIKIFAEPLLFTVPQDCEEYYEAKRLLKFLDYFLGIDSSTVPTNSLLREFIGGGCFEI
ncbi:MAG: nucleoside kinase [Eubacterium sp.]|nr:nucleoside kinase [Eubacterium sp.]